MSKIKKSLSENMYKSNLQKSGCVLVCVTAQPGAKHLIAAGKDIATRLNRNLEILTVIPVALDNAKKAKDINYIYELAREAEADIQVYFNDDAALTTAAHASKQCVSQIVTGMPIGNAVGFIELVHLLLPNIKISMADENNIYNINPVIIKKTKEQPKQKNNLVLCAVID